MKQIIGLFFFSMFSIHCMRAQSIQSMSLGPYIGTKISVNTTQHEKSPDDRTQKLTLNRIPDFGAIFYLPLSHKNAIASSLDLGYSTYSDQYNGVNNDDSFVGEYNYFIINPNFIYSNFILGLNIGIPIRWSIRNLSNTFVITSTTGEDMVTNAEVRLGGIIPLFQNELGTLNLTILGGYMLRQVEIDPLSGAYYNRSPRMASLMIGINYLFTLKKEE